MSLSEKLEGLSPFKSAAERAAVLNNDESATGFNATQREAAEKELTLNEPVSSIINNTRDNIKSIFGGAWELSKKIITFPVGFAVDLATIPLAATQHALRWTGDVVRAGARAPILIADTAVQHTAGTFGRLLKSLRDKTTEMVSKITGKEATA